MKLNINFTYEGCNVKFGIRRTYVGNLRTTEKLNLRTSCRVPNLCHNSAGRWRRCQADSAGGLGRAGLGLGGVGPWRGVKYYLVQHLPLGDVGKVRKKCAVYG